MPIQTAWSHCSTLGNRYEKCDRDRAGSEGRRIAELSRDDAVSLTRSTRMGRAFTTPLSSAPCDSQSLANAIDIRLNIALVAIGVQSKT
jgi:hypothetical protein